MIDQEAEAEMLKEYPYMGNETAGTPDCNKMWYFSINEFFGGEHGPGASFTYSLEENNVLMDPTGRLDYNTWYDADINMVDKAGEIQKYRESDEWFESKWRESEHVMPFYGYALNEEEKRSLVEILDKYQVTAWQEPKVYQNQPESNHIEEGDFFNLSPDTHYNGIGEQEFEVRSAFETFIYVYDTDGKRMRLHYDNNCLPENYNEFRKELWDFVMGHGRAVDWRPLLDQWGRTHLKILQERETSLNLSLSR